MIGMNQFASHGAPSFAFPYRLTSCAQAEALDFRFFRFGGKLQT
jgi:hypothetical protein